MHSWGSVTRGTSTHLREKTLFFVGARGLPFVVVATPTSQYLQDGHAARQPGADDGVPLDEIIQQQQRAAGVMLRGVLLN